MFRLQVSFAPSDFSGGAFLGAGNTQAQLVS